MTAVIAALSGAVFASPFTYQGELIDSGVPADGMYDMVFTLTDSPFIGIALQQIAMNNVEVSDGLFEVDLDYLDSLFDGSDRWLAITVDGTPLNPRIQIQYSPYSIRAINAQDATNAEHADIASDLEVPWVVVTDTDIVDATSTRGIAVRGYAMSGSFIFPGVLGETDSIESGAAGVVGRANSQSDTSPSTGVRGETNSTGASGFGVHGIHRGDGSAVYGENDGSGVGVSGQSKGVGVLGSTPDGTGVHGLSTNGLGIFARSFTGIGLRSLTNSGAAAMEGSNVDADTEFFGASEDYGLAGYNLNNVGVGVYGQGGSIGVRGVSLSDIGGYAGVDGIAGGIDSLASSVFGVRGYAQTSPNEEFQTAYGVYGIADTFNSKSSAYAVYGETVWNAGVQYAGYFDGDVHVEGTLSKLAGSFKIDHPLDPENKYLSHSFMESPEMMNVYSGVVVLDDQGRGMVKLPEYFEALNRDFRYQLTAIGGAMPGLHVSSEIQKNSFAIDGGMAGLKVSWEVSGVRQDPSALYHPIVVEEGKVEQHRGKYLDPGAYGFGDEKAIHPSPKQN